MRQNYEELTVKLGVIVKGSGCLAFIALCLISFQNCSKYAALF
jgi:hypothetical protein